MAYDRGLPSVPRGLDRALTNYLQSVHEVVLRLSGLGRNSQDSRAVRVSEGRGVGTTGTASIGQASVSTRHLADGAVTSSKLGQGAVTEKAILDGAVTASKLAPGVLPVLVTGVATDGETVTLPGEWAALPLIAVSALFLPAHEDEPTEEPGKDPEEQPEEQPEEEPEIPDESPVRVGVTGLHEITDEQGKGTGQWQFEAAGDFEWSAIGYRK